MSLNNLFRKEAVDYQRSRIYGHVILTQPMSYFIISAIVCIALIFVGVFLFSQNYSRKESVRGYLIPDSGIAKIYADQVGVITKLNVTIGQVVNKGDAIAEIRQERLSNKGLSSQKVLLESVLRELIQIEERYTKTFEQEENEIINIKRRIKNFEQALLKIIEEKNYQTETVELANKRYQDTLALKDKGFVSEQLTSDAKENLIVLKQREINLEREQASVSLALYNEKASLFSLEYDFDEQRAGFISRKEELLQQKINLEQSQGYVVTASIDGVISSVLAVEGSQINMNVPLVTISPPNTNLYARLLVPSRAAGLIEIGQQAKLQYDAFPYQRFGIYSGTITSVSQSIINPNDLITPIPINEAFYIVDLMLEKQSVDVKGKQVLLKAGMSLKADVTLENRTLIQWFLDPLFSVTKKI